VLFAPSFRLSVFIYTFLFISTTYFFFTDFYLHPGYLFNFSGDGIKNNSTYLFHVIHDTSWWHYTGMNYPYGEHIIYTDCQPVLAQAARALCYLFPGLKGSEMVLFNVSMFFTWWLGGLALLKLFRKMQLPAWWALLFALCIILMNPQINRLLCGHYGLSHPFLPFLFLWWYDIFTDKETQLLSSIKITTLLSVMAFVHVYQLAYGLLVTALFSACYVFVVKGFVERIIQFFKLLFLQCFLPLLLFFTVNRLSDYLQDRPIAPSRFFMDSATPWSVFLHPFSAIGTSLYAFFGKTPDPNHEVHVYAGILSFVFVVLFLAFIFLAFLTPFKKYWASFIPYQKALLFISLFSLFIAMGLPFAKTGLNHWYYYSGYFRQFRSIGRFAVVFYFAIHILGVSWLSKQCLGAKENVKRWLIISVFASIMILDMFVFLSETKFFPKESKGFVNLPGDLKKLDLSTNTYQAIITNPFFHVGSENSMYFDKKDALRQSLQLSVQTGIPLVNSMLSRSSLYQTIRSTQLAHPLFQLPDVLNKLPNSKPFILLESKGVIGESHFSLNRISYRLPIIFENNEIVLKRLDLFQFEKEYAILNDSIEKLLTTFNNSTIKKSINTYSLGGDYKQANSHNVIFDIDTKAAPNRVISLRFKTNNIGSSCILKQTDKNSNIVSCYTEYIGNWIEQIDENETMIRIPVNISQSTIKLSVELKNTEFDITYLIRNALLQPEGAHYFRKEGKDWYYNNFKTSIKESN